MIIEEKTEAEGFDGMNQEEMAKLANEVFSDYEVDEALMSNRRIAIKEAVRYAMQDAGKEKTYPFEKSSNVMYPLVAEACLSFLSQMKPALICGDAPYQVMPADGIEEGAVANEIAQSSDFLKTQFDTDWKMDLDRLLAYVPNTGMCFKKVYLEEVGDGTYIVNSEFVKLDDLSWSLTANSYASIPRINHTFPLYPFQIDEYIASGYFKEFTYSKSSAEGNASDSQAPHMFIEQHRHDYIITMHKETKTIVRVVERRYNHFIPFGLIPSFDGDLYYIGYGDLLKPINDTINSNTNMLQDAGNLSLGTFGLIGNDARLQSGSNKIKPPFDLKKVNMTGKDIADSVYLFPRTEPSGVIFQLLDLYIQNGRSLANAVGGGDSLARSDMPGMTAMTVAEKSATVLKGIFNSLVMSITSEFRLIQQMYFDTGIQFLNPALVKIIPTSDVNALITALDSMQAQILMNFLQDPYLDAVEVRKRIFKAAKMKDIDKLFNQQPPTPPEIEAKLTEIRVQELMQMNEAKKLDNENLKLQIEERKLRVDEAKANAEIQLKGAQTIKTLRDSDKTEIETDSMLEELEAVVKEGQNEEIQQDNTGAVPRMEATE